MTRITPRFLPVVKIYAPPFVERRAYYRDWMASQLQEGTYLKPGAVTNAQWLKIGEDSDYDGSPDRPTRTKALALCCDYKIGFRGTRANRWTRTPSTEEKAATKYALDLINDKIAGINEKLAAKPAPTGEALDELNANLNASQAIAEQLQSGAGFLDTADDALNTGAHGLWWRLSAANVPVELTEIIALDEDRAISFRLNRATAPDEQAAFEWELEIAAGNTCYALSMGSDGNSTEWRHYRSMKPAARGKLRAQWIALLDLGRETVADKQAILTQERNASALKLAIKKRQDGAANAANQGDKKGARQDAGETKSETTQLDSIDKEIERIKAKKRTETKEKELQKVEAKLFLARESFQLQEGATNLIGKDVDVTIQFLRAGYVVIRSNDDKFVYENKALTSLPTPFNRQLPKGAQMRIRSSGGQWVFVPGAPEWKNALILSQSFENDAPFFTGVNFKVTGDAIGDCAMVYRVNELREPTPDQAGLYQLELQLNTFGKHTPELYYLGVHRPATAATRGALLWNSETALSNYGLSRVIDVLLQDDKRRARLAQVVINGGDSLPPGLVGCECEVSLVDRWNNFALVGVVGAGYIGSDESGRVGEISTSSGFASVQLFGSHTTLGAVGTEEFLNRIIDAPVPTDGEFPNDVVRRACRDAGLPAIWWQRIPEGDAGWGHIAATKPGAYPAGKPSGRTTYLELCRDVTRSHCNGADFWSDALGLRLDEVSGRDRTAQGNYGTPATGVAAASPFCLRGMEGFKVTQDTRDYVTTSTATGRRDERTGRRWSKTESIPQATSEQTRNSVFFIGHDIPKDIQDETLDNEAKCLLAARRALHITPLTPDGLAPWWIHDAKLDLNPDLATGDLLPIFGLSWILDTIEFGALNAGEAGQTMKVTFQLAQDATRAQLEGLGG